MLNNDHAAFEAAQSRAAAAVSCESVVLPSGLTVLCRTMPGYSSVHAIYATGFGSIHRAFKLDGRQVTLPAGTAHFLEHKMCETPKGDSFNFYAKTGASANAFTSYDRTCYLFSATQKIDENLDILLGMVGKPWFTKATIAKEQGIIGQEIKMYDDSPDWRLLNALFRCLYADHPLRDDIAGTVESIAELTPQMLYSCTKAFYAPSNMVLSVAGKITLAQAVDACKRNGLYRARAPHEVEWAIPAQSGPLPHREAVFTMPVTKPCFGVAYREEPLAEGDIKRELLLDMLGDLVVGGLTKLYRRLYDEALVNPEFSGDFIAVRGACAVAFTGESDTPREVVELLQAEIERMRRDGVDPEVFMLVKNQMYGELLGDVEAVDDAAEEAAAACLKGRTLADEIAALAELTVDFKEAPGAQLADMIWAIKPESVVVSGDASVLNDMDSIVLDSFDLLSVTTESTSHSYAILVPDGCENLSGVTRATLEIGYPDKTVADVTTHNIRVENASASRNVELLTQELSVRIFGTAAEMEGITGEDVAVVADLSDYAVASGTYMIPAQVRVGDGKTIGVSGTYQIQVRIPES